MNRLQLLFLLIIGCSSFAYAQEESSNWESINEDNYKIDHPSDWTADKTGTMGSSFILFSPRQSAADDFQENINLLIQDLTGHEMDLIQFVELSEQQVRTLVTDGEILLSERHKKGETEYQKVIYTGKQGIYSLKFEQFYWVIDDKAYVLTLTCKEDDFEAYRETGEKILESFELIFPE